jgi:hypothetical protein
MVKQVIKVAKVATVLKATQVNTDATVSLDAKENVVKTEWKVLLVSQVYREIKVNKAWWGILVSVDDVVQSENQVKQVFRVQLLQPKDKKENKVVVAHLVTKVWEVQPVPKVVKANLVVWVQSAYQAKSVPEVKMAHEVYQVSLVWLVNQAFAEQMAFLVWREDQVHQVTHSSIMVSYSHGTHRAHKFLLVLLVHQLSGQDIRFFTPKRMNNLTDKTLAELAHAWKCSHHLHSTNAIWEITVMQVEKMIKPTGWVPVKLFHQVQKYVAKTLRDLCLDVWFAKLQLKLWPFTHKNPGYQTVQITGRACMWAIHL